MEYTITSVFYLLYLPFNIISLLLTQIGLNLPMNPHTTSTPPLQKGPTGLQRYFFTSLTSRMVERPYSHSLVLFQVV